MDYKIRACSTPGSVIYLFSRNLSPVNVVLVKKLVKFAIFSCKKTKGLLLRPSLSRQTVNVSALHKGPVEI